MFTAHNHWWDYNKSIYKSGDGQSHRTVDGVSGTLQADTSLL